MIARAKECDPAEWAWREFAGTPYLWGGVTGAGIDCSALLQNTFLARGIQLPRDAHQQVGSGQVVEAGSQRTGDLLFFRARDREQIGHVGLVASDGMLVHSTIERGGVARDSLAASSGGHLLARLVAIRRLE